jgi:hypothetical protein
MTHSWNTALKSLAVTLSVPGHRSLVRYLGFNIAEVDVTWGSDVHTVVLRVFDRNHNTVIEHALSLPAASLKHPAASVPADVAACAHAPLNNGMPIKCMALLRNCSPTMGPAVYAHVVLGHLAVIVLLLLIGLSVVGPVLYAAANAKRWWRTDSTGGFLARFGLYGALFALYMNILLGQMSVT